MKTALIQFNASDNKSDNLARALSFVEEAALNGAQFILLPEVFILRRMINTSADMKAASETIPGESTKALMAVAKKYKVYILAGSIYEKVGVAKKAYNTSVLINASGKIQAKYRKINLFDAVIGDKKIKESDLFLKGRECTHTKVKDFRVGLSVCYDLRFAHLYRQYGQRGVDVLCVPSAFTKKTGEAHWEVLLRARAIENLSYVLAPNQIGLDGKGVINYGHSMVVDPWGRVIARASGDQEEIIYADIDREIIKEARKILPGIVKQ